jgi:hypothetical protein
VTLRGLFGLGLWLALLVVGAPTAAFAQDGGDYARVTAPDVALASGFLTQVMGCDPLDVSSQRALLECSQGTVVEVVQGGMPAPGTPALRLRVENVDAALVWLQRRHVPVIGDHVAGTAGVDGLVRIDVQTPWGQTLELVGHGAGRPDVPAAQLAAE